MYGGSFFGGYGLYILFSLPALLLGFWAQMKVKGAFDKYSRVRTFTGVTGAEVARRILDSNNLQNVKVEMVSGFLSDHYDPGSRTLRLSQNVYQSNSVAAAGIAAHESGHAIQHAQAYAPLADTLRNRPDCPDRQLARSDRLHGWPFLIGHDRRLDWVGSVCRDRCLLVNHLAGRI